MSRWNQVSLILEDFVSLLYPRLCQACGASLVRNERILCLSCILDMPLTSYHIEKDNNLEKALWGRCYIERAAAYANYTRGGKMQILIHRLKYQGIKEIGVYLGNLYGNILNSAGFLDEIDYLVPVPLNASKERKRGFNQSMLISEGISQASGKQVLKDALVRKINTSTQTRKSRVDRWENVENIFMLRAKEKLHGQHVLLIDDVITTGSTIEACVSELKKAHKIKVSVVALASAV